MNDKQDKVGYVAVDTMGYLNVCLCPCEHSQCYTPAQSSIPLKDLVKTLLAYVGQYGGSGNLQIAMMYKDKDGTFKPLDPEQSTNNGSLQ